MFQDDTPPAARPGLQPAARDPFGRVRTSDGSQENLKSIADLANIKKPVGIDLDNNADDVARLEMLLDQTGDMDLKPSEGPTGYFGQRLLEAITRFQKRMGLPPTGMVRPGDQTHRALLAKTTEQIDTLDPAFEGEPAMGRPGPAGPSTY